MIGRTLSAVTLDKGALSDNFIKIETAASREPNRIIDVKIGGLTGDGVREFDPLRVF
jgi:hypothetical protein